MNSMVAIIKSVIGQVFAVSADGVKRQVFEGDRLFQGEQLLTGEFGAVTLQMPDGQNIELGNNQQWPLPTDNSKQQDTDTSRDELLQAIAAGIDLTESLPDTAAGPAATGGSGNGGGHSFVLLTEVGGRVDPIIGFPTAGFGGIPEFPEERHNAVIDNGDDTPAVVVPPPVASAMFDWYSSSVA